MPDKRDISPAHIPRLLPDIGLIEVEMPGERYRVRLAGSRLRDVHDCETTGLCLDELDWGDKPDCWLAAYHRIAEEGNRRRASSGARARRKSTSSSSGSSCR